MDSFLKNIISDCEFLKQEAKLPLLQTYDQFYKSVASDFATKSIRFLLLCINCWRFQKHVSSLLVCCDHVHELRLGPGLLRIDECKCDC